MSVTVIAVMRSTREDVDELLSVVHGAVPDVLAEPGCQGYAPHTVGRETVLLVESWESREHLAVHAETAELAAFNERIAPLLVSPVEITVARPAQGPA